jgi:nucleotide-binding universal stress UspA family protein
MYRTILFAVEDDEALPAAIGAVAAYAGFWHAKVRVLHVHRIDPASRNEPSNGLVDAVVERLRAQDVDAEGETQSVKTDDEIAKVVAAETARIQPDLLVVGSRGRSGVAGLVLGSVSHRIAAGLDVPVLVIRASHTALRPPRKVLVAVEDSPASDEALAEAAVVAARAGAEVLVLHVQHMIAVQGSAIVESEAQARAIVDRAVEKLAAQGVRAWGGSVIDHSVAAAIVAAAERFEADLVVLGSRRPTGIRGVLLGSVGHEVVSRLRRPVLLARRVRETEQVH